MTKAKRTLMRATRAALPLLTAAGLLTPSPVAAQPGAYGYPYAPPQDAQPQYAQPQKPELTAPRKPQLFAPEGPVTSWDPLRFAVALETRTTWLFNGAAKRLAGERLPTGEGLSLQADVLRPSAKLALRLDLGWTSTSTSSFQPSSSLSEKLDTNLFQLGASLRYHVYRWLAPFARLAGGMGWDKLTVAGMKDRELFEQGSLGAGVFLRSPGVRLWQGAFSPLLGLMGNIEAGYALATGSDLTLQASLPSASTPPIPTSTVPIGHVGRSAPYVRASRGLAF